MYTQVTIVVLPDITDRRDPSHWFPEEVADLTERLASRAGVCAVGDDPLGSRVRELEIELDRLGGGDEPPTELLVWLASIVKCCTGLRKLSLVLAPGEQWDCTILQASLLSSAHLLELVLHDFGSSWLSCFPPTLRRLHLWYFDFAADGSVTIDAGAIRLPDLRRLQLTPGRGAWPHEYAPSLGGWLNLQSLLAAFAASAAVLEHVCLSGPGLIRVLSISDLQQLEVCLGILPVYLRSLRLDDWFGGGYDESVMTAFLLPCPNLAHLRQLQRIETTGDALVFRIRSSCMPPSITEVVVDNCETDPASVLARLEDLSWMPGLLSFSCNFHGDASPRRS